jgi:hypothetical protein
LHAFLPALGDEGCEFAEVAELGFINARFCADGRRLSHLSDDHANLSRGHLNPWMLGYGVDHDPLEAKTGHEEFGLVAGFALEGHDVVAGKRRSKPLANQPDLCGTDAVNGSEDERD